MISRWSDWRRFPRAHRSDDIVAPVCPGIYEIRIASSGALFRFGVTENIAQTLSGLVPKPRSSFRTWLFRSERNAVPDLEYRTCATSTKAEAKAAAAGMIGRRELFFRGAA
jgi:hypothetical protein